LAFQKLNPFILSRFYEDLYLIERDPKVMAKVLKDLNFDRGGNNFYAYFLDLKKVDTPFILGLLSHPKSIQADSLDLEVLLTKRKHSQKLFSWREKSVLGHFLLRSNPDESLLSVVQDHLDYLKKMKVDIKDFNLAPMKKSPPRSSQKKDKVHSYYESIASHLLLSQKILLASKEYGYRVGPHCEKKKRELLNGTLENEKLINLCLRHFFKREQGHDKRFLENMGWITKETYLKNKILLTRPIQYKLDD
jgi:hypothetical protein